MALIARATGGVDFKPTPPGVYLARCFRIIDLGTQRGEWKGKEKWSRKVMFQWELYGEDEEGNALTMDDGRPMSISKQYTLSLGENAQLRADLKAWRGRDFTPEELNEFDISKVLGVACMINVSHGEKDGKTYANISGVTPVPKAMRAAIPKPINDLQLFDVSEPDMDVMGKLSDRMQEKIKACKEWQKVDVNKAASQSAKPQSDEPGGAFDDMADDIPY